MKQKNKKNNNDFFIKKDDSSLLKILFNRNNKDVSKNEQIFRKLKLRIKKEKKNIFHLCNNNIKYMEEAPRISKIKLTVEGNNNPNPIIKDKVNMTDQNLNSIEAKKGSIFKCK